MSPITAVRAELVDALKVRAAEADALGPGALPTVSSGKVQTRRPRAHLGTIPPCIVLHTSPSVSGKAPAGSALAALREEHAKARAFVEEYGRLVDGWAEQPPGAVERQVAECVRRSQSLGREEGRLGAASGIVPQGLGLHWVQTPLDGTIIECSGQQRGHFLGILFHAPLSSWFMWDVFFTHDLFLNTSRPGPPPPCPCPRPPPPLHRPSRRITALRINEVTQARQYKLLQTRCVGRPTDHTPSGTTTHSVPSNVPRNFVAALSPTTLSEFPRLPTTLQIPPP